MATGVMAAVASRGDGNNMAATNDDYMMTHFPFSAHGLFFLSGACIRGSLFSFSSTYSLILQKQKTTRFIIQVCKDTWT